MKNIFKLFAIGLILAVAVSCDINKTPEFSPCDSFVAFDKLSFTVNEDHGTLTIPVTIASVQPVQATVSYAVTDSTAKAGVNFTLKDESAILNFDGKTRTQNIVIDITDYDQYTGALIFTIELISAGTLDIGANSVCTVKIVDLDHPLASVIGEYSATADGPGISAPWDMRISTDDEDDTMVWVDYICPFASQYPTYNWSVYGNVSADLKTITFPLGQELEDGMIFAGAAVTSSGSYNLTDEGNIVFELQDDGTWKTEDGYALFDGGLYYGAVVHSCSWTKK